MGYVTKPSLTLVSRLACTRNLNTRTEVFLTAEPTHAHTPMHNLFSTGIVTGAVALEGSKHQEGEVLGEWGEEKSCQSRVGEEGGGMTAKIQLTLQFEGLCV